VTKTSRLITEPHIASTDDFYERLLTSHRGLDDTESQALNARLVLILANHIGDETILKDAIDLASKAGAKKDG